jgi:probable O-glycosylation ligase (exosortase A-associated)
MGLYVTYLMAILGTSMGWLMPFIGLMVYYWFAILRPPFLWFWSFPNKWDVPRFSLYIGASTLIGWAIQGFGSLQGLRGTHIALFGLVIYILTGLFGWQVLAVDPNRAWDLLDTQIKIIVMVIATLTLVRDARSIRIFIWVIVVSLGYLGKVLNDWYFISPMYLHNNGFGGIDNNGVGMIMVMSVPLSFFMAVYDKRLWVRLLTVMAVVYQVHVILFSYSRGSQLGLCMVGAMIFLFAIFQLPRKLLTVGLAVVFVAITLYLAGEGVRQRFMSIFAEERDASAESRFTTWSAAWHCMQEHPMGVGPRNFGFYAERYGLTHGKAVHNLYLQTGADYGVIGMFALIAFYGGTLVSTFFMSRTDVAKALGWPRYIGLGVCTSIAGFMLCSIFIGMESVEVGYVICAVGLTTVAHVNRVRDASPAGYGLGLPELVEVPEPGETIEDIERERRNAGFRPVLG